MQDDPDDVYRCHEVIVYANFDENPHKSGVMTHLYNPTTTSSWQADKIALRKLMALMKQNYFPNGIEIEDIVNSCFTQHKFMGYFVSVEVQDPVNAHIKIFQPTHMCLAISKDILSTGSTCKFPQYLHTLNL